MYMTFCIMIKSKTNILINPYFNNRLMHVIVDCTTTQNQLKHHGVGVYTKNVVKELLEYKNIKFSLLLFDGDSTLDPIQEKRKGKY